MFFFFRQVFVWRGVQCFILLVSFLPSFFHLRIRARSKSLKKVGTFYFSFSEYDFLFFCYNVYSSMKKVLVWMVTVFTKVCKSGKVSTRETETFNAFLGQIWNARKWIILNRNKKRTQNNKWYKIEVSNTVFSLHCLTFVHVFLYFFSSSCFISYKPS